MPGWLLDSNIIIGILNDTIALEQLSSNIITGVPIAGTVFISAVTVLELYALSGMGTAEERTVDAVVAKVPVLPITASIARQAGILARTRARGVRTDLLIAATALAHDAILITNNPRDFKKIVGLKLQTI